MTDETKALKKFPPSDWIDEEFFFSPEKNENAFFYSHFAIRILSFRAKENWKLPHSRDSVWPQKLVLMLSPKDWNHVRKKTEWTKVSKTNALSACQATNKYTREKDGKKRNTQTRTSVELVSSCASLDDTQRKIFCIKTHTTLTHFIFLSLSACQFLLAFAFAQMDRYSHFDSVAFKSFTRWFPTQPSSQ